MYGNSELVGNPLIFFDKDTPPEVITLNLDEVSVRKLNDDELYLRFGTDEDICDMIPIQNYDMKINAVGIRDGEYWLFDQQIRIRDNEIDNPMEKGGGDFVEQGALTRIQRDNDKKSWSYEVKCR